MPLPTSRKTQNARRVPVTLKVPLDALGQIDRAVEATGSNRSAYMTAAAARQAQRDLRRTEAA